MDNLLYYTSEETIITTLIPLSANTLKDDFFHFGGNLGDLPNHGSPTIATEKIWYLNVWH